MAFSKDYKAYDRKTDFHFYFSGQADGWESQSLEEGKRIGLKEVRLHFDSTFNSVEDFIVYVSSINGSAYNLKLISEALNGVDDIIVQFSNEIILFSDDQLVFNGSMVSNTHLYGLEALGWSVRG